MRKQYHLRPSEKGLQAWDIHRLIEYTSSLTPVDIPLSSIKELDETFWFTPENTLPTCRIIAEHARLIEAADLTFPIIIDPENRVMDGMHRVCKALNQNKKNIKAYRLPTLPPPDYIGVSPQELPYKE